MFDIFNKRGIRDIPVSVGADVSNLREKFDICFIDDRKLTPLLNTLRSHTYKVHRVEDVERLADVSIYPILVCDIMGVGKKFGSDNEGWHLIDELRKKYPLKYIIGHSAAPWDISYTRYVNMCDAFIKKDATIESKISVFDKGIASMGDPQSYWKRCRNILLDIGISTYDVALLEDAYVRGVVSGDKSYMEKSLKRLEGKAMYSDVIHIVRPTVSSALTSLAVLADVVTLLAK